MVSVIVTLDGGAPWPLDSPVADEALRSRLRACTDFWIVARADDDTQFVQFGLNPDGRGFFEHWRSGRSQYSEIHGRDEAEREALRFVANPARYSVGP